jgi:hypothetical protein
MAEFKLDRFKYNWTGAWTENTAYNRDDVVLAGGRSFVCLEGHTAGDDFSTDLYKTLEGSNPPIATPRWRLMTGGKKYRGEWATATEYFEGDLISKDGSIWQAIRAHESGNFDAEKSFDTVVTYNITVDAPSAGGGGFRYYFNGVDENPALTFTLGATYKFIQDDSSNVYYGGSEELNEPNQHPLLFGNSQDYDVGNVYNVGVKYIIDGAEVSEGQYSALFVGASNREIHITVADYAPATFYFHCQFHPGMGNTITTKRQLWELFLDQIKFVGDWTTATNYGPGALVDYGGNVYRCIEGHVAQAILEDDLAKWELFFEGREYQGPWQVSTNYQINDLVQYGGTIFRCTTSHTSDTTALDPDNFIVEFPGFQFDGEWSPTTQYSLGDIVRYGGEVWYATAPNFDSDPYRDPADSTRNWIKFANGYNYRGFWNETEAYRPGDIVQRGGILYKALIEIRGNFQDGSSADYLDDGVWEKIGESVRWRGTWAGDTEYLLGDVVYYLGTAYTNNLQHISTNQNFPGDNGNGFYYWDVLVDAGEPAGLRQTGDLLTFGLSRTLQGDGSTKGNTNLAIGDKEQLLSVSTEYEAFWRNFTGDSDVIWVATNGVDEPGRGLRENMPFRTVRYAADYVLDNYESGIPVKIRVATGRYEEIGPISVNAGTVVMGDELRSTTIVATPPIAEYATDFAYLQLGFQHLETFIFSVMNNQPVTPTDGNTQTQDLSTGLAAGALPVADISTLIDNVVDEIGFRTSTGFVQPTMTGNVNKVGGETIRAATTQLKNNQLFIAEEIWAWLQLNYGTEQTFTKTRVVNDFQAFVRGFTNDLDYDSNYYSIQSARRYANATTGSAGDDLFYFRDITGLRNCTLDGLTGALNPPGVFDLYQRPTGGSYCSLDPGWGPDDNRCWIHTRSPYIQGVTTLGFAAVGQKIDGALHNGGNKSMVSNDFTQVISDGIGAWVLNNARAELVSVFTYYSQVGYLAENGGVIRATNGNNSYGSFGSIADGNDPLETPQTVSVFNRNNEATVQSAQTSGFGDNIQLLEYDNAGQEYTNATFNVVGAGINADLQYSDSRDGGLFQSRLNVPPDSGQAGGAGYTLYGSNAQVTADSSTSIILTQGSSFTEEDILGMRLIITSGDGAGQYGYVQAYNASNKTATIYKESDDTPGWDNVIPGTPAVASLTTNAAYSIEPRMTVSEPGFAADDANLLNGRPAKDLVFGDTSSIFTGLEGNPGTGTTDGVTAVAAVWNVTKEGTSYTVTINFAGTGYAVGDTITITGDLIGGASPANDLTITVTGTTEDSTNSITTFTSAGTGSAGTYVLLSNPNFIQYSSTGESGTWAEVNLPYAPGSGWSRLAAGDNKFVAISPDEARCATSSDAVTWTQRTMPAAHAWYDIAFGNGKWVAVAPNSNDIAYSSDGINFVTQSIPDDVAGDSALSQWQGVAYGQGKFVAISGSQEKDVATSTDGITWTRTTGALPTDDYDFLGLEYGAGRFVAITKDGKAVYSLNGTTWYDGGDLPSEDGSTRHNWKSFAYGQGIFMAVCDQQGLEIGGDTVGGTTSFVTISENGFQWQQKNLSSTQFWATVGFGNPNQTGTWLCIADSIGIGGISKVLTGARAKVRANVLANSFKSVKIWDPGSGYSSAPTITIEATDEDITLPVYLENRIGNGVLAQPDFINRGSGYKQSSTQITITGDGFADYYPESNVVTLAGVTTVPGPGVQVRFAEILDETTDDPDDEKLYAGTTVTDLGDDGSGNGTRLVRLTVTPRLRIENNLSHASVATLRQRYSQCRISGHDFLDIGTGNFTETNYPTLYAGGAYFVSAPENEVLEVNGGRVFYTSTDQDGNFRAGELFAVQQATGIVTISAEFFDLDGLSELALGGVRLGGSGAVVREFSTDVNFTEDSNNVVPTQRAIATFLANRLSEGGQDIETNQLVAGVTRIGNIGDFQNVIETTTGVVLNIPKQADFSGAKASVGGTMISQMLFLRTFNDTTQ